MNHSNRSVRRRWWLGLVTPLLLILLAGCGITPDPTPTPGDAGQEEFDLEIVMNDMSFSPNRITGSPGETLVILLKNPDTMTHDLTIDDLDGEKVQASLAARQEMTFTLQLPDEPGEWVFYCSVPGHRQLGMEGVLVVQ